MWRGSPVQREFVRTFVKMKILLVLAICLGASSARSIFGENNGLSGWLFGLADYAGFLDPFGFEYKIRIGLDEAKNILKKGDKKFNIPPLDPFHLPYKKFDFDVEETALKGSFQNVTVQGFSDFEVKNVKFSYLPYPHAYVELFWPRITSDGIYNLTGKIMDSKALNGTGKYKSETGNMTVMMDLLATKVHQWLQVSYLNITYDVKNQKLNFTNGLDNDNYATLSENVTLATLRETQNKYFPSMLNSLKMIMNHFLLGFTYDDLQDYVLGTFN